LERDSSVDNLLLKIFFAVRYNMPPNSAVTIWGHENDKYNTPTSFDGRSFNFRENVTEAKRKENFTIAPNTIPRVVLLNK